MREVIPLGLIAGGAVLVLVFLPSLIITFFASLACYGTPFPPLALAAATACWVSPPLMWLTLVGFGVAIAVTGALLLRRNGSARLRG